MELGSIGARSVSADGGRPRLYTTQDMAALANSCTDATSYATSQLRRRSSTRLPGASARTLSLSLFLSPGAWPVQPSGRVSRTLTTIASAPPSLTQAGKGWSYRLTGLSATSSTRTAPGRLRLELGAVWYRVKGPWYDRPYTPRLRATIACCNACAIAYRSHDVRHNAAHVYGRQVWMYSVQHCTGV